MTWLDRNAAARAAGEYTQQDRDDASGVNNVFSDLGTYARCGVGEQADRYGDDLIFEYARRYGVRDRVLNDLGLDFSHAVGANNFDEADRLLAAIEDRALEIKRSAS